MVQGRNVSLQLEYITKTMGISRRDFCFNKHWTSRTHLKTQDVTPSSIVWSPGSSSASYRHIKGHIETSCDLSLVTHMCLLLPELLPVDQTTDGGVWMNTEMPCVFKCLLYVHRFKIKSFLEELSTWINESPQTQTMCV